MKGKRKHIWQLVVAILPVCVGETLIIVSSIVSGDADVGSIMVQVTFAFILLAIAGLAVSGLFNPFSIFLKSLRGKKKDSG